MTPSRPLSGLRVGISISGGTDVAEYGFTDAGINRLTVRVTRALLEHGRALAFGHDWRDNGIMDAVCRSALDSFGFPGEQAPRPLILSLIPWPDETLLDRELRERLGRVLAVTEAGLPRELAAMLPVDLARRPKTDPDLRYARSRALTHLRRRLNRECRARICLGGKERQFSGRYPGIFEEALFALQAEQPLYLVGLLGGAAKQVGQAILDRAPLPPSFGQDVFHPPEKGCLPLADLYREWEGRQQVEWQQRPRDPLDDRALDLKASWELAREFGALRLAHCNYLSVEENRRLLVTDLEDEALHLVLMGLRRMTLIHG